MMPAKDLKELLRVYFIMGSSNCKGRDPVVVLEQAIAGGISIFQFREKGPGALTGKDKYLLAEKLQQVCQDNDVPFIVNDDVELAKELDADGIHVGQEDMSAVKVREQAGDKILGVSTHTIEEAHRAIKDGADYLGLGPTYPTSSKDDAKEVAGVEIIQRFRRKGITVPIVGIGGITAANAQTVMEAGADGVSVISAIAGAADVESSAKHIRQAIAKSTNI